MFNSIRSNWLRLQFLSVRIWTCVISLLNKLYGAESSLRSWQTLSWSWNSPPIMKPKNSLLCSLQPNTGPILRQVNPSSPYLLKNHFNSILAYTPMSYKLSLPFGFCISLHVYTTPTLESVEFKGQLHDGQSIYYFCWWAKYKPIFHKCIYDARALLRSVQSGPSHLCLCKT
jgi:hypothetical protein